MIPTSRLVILYGLLILQGMRAVAQIPKTNTAYIKQKWTNISYDSSSAAQKLDIYLPNKGEGPFPVVIAIHGGAFVLGDKADFQLRPMLQALEHGYAVVSINYRMSGEALFPKNINDVKAAIRWVRANALTYHLVSGKIAAWGGSAGGNLASLAGTTGDQNILEDLSQGNSTVSSQLQAVVDWYGPIDFLQMDKQFKASGKGLAIHNNANSPESKLLGKGITFVPDLVKAANPSTYISKNSPPFFIEHGKDDPLVPTEQSINFAAALDSIVGREKVSLILLADTKHGGSAFESPANMDSVFRFLDKYMK